MKERVKKAGAWTAFLGGIALLAAAIWLDEGVPNWVNGLLCGFGGACLGAGGSGLAVGWITRRLSPKERAEVILAETDERNVAIREKAAKDSWYWTGWLLWAPFVASLVTGDDLFIALTAGVIVLHNAFLLVNMARWSRRM